MNCSRSRESCKQVVLCWDALRLPLPVCGFVPIVRDIKMSLPDNLVFGIANSSLMDGRLLLALDIVYKQWDNADLFGAISFEMSSSTDSW